MRLLEAPCGSGSATVGIDIKFKYKANTVEFLILFVFPWISKDLNNEYPEK
jgi:hypothetical protein